MPPTTDFPDIDTANEVENDPLAGLGIDFAAEVATIQATADTATAEECPDEKFMERITTFLEKPVANADGLFLDFETIPDHSREHLFGFGPLPTLPPVDGAESLMPPDQFVTQGIKEIETWFAKHNPPEDWVVKVRDAEKALPKPRKGASDVYDEHSQRVNKIAAASNDRIKKMSVTPLFCRICSVSFAVGDEKPVSIYAGDDPMLEKHLLEMCWRMLARHKRLIGYGVYHFDAPVLMARSMLLGVHPSIVLDRKKYGNSNVIDLMRELYGDSPPMGMKPTCRLMGIEPDAGDCEGSQVYEMFKAGRKDEICKYNESDVVLCQKLRRKLAGYFTA